MSSPWALSESEAAPAAAVLEPLGRVRIAGSGRSVALELTDGAAAVAEHRRAPARRGHRPGHDHRGAPDPRRRLPALHGRHDRGARGARGARAGGAAVMRLAVESGVLFQRALREIPRVPTRIAFPVIGPVMQLVLLTAVLSSVTQLPGYPARSSVQFMTAGVLALTVLAGAGGAGFQMVQDIDTGFFDKLRVAPIRRSAIVLGLLLTDADAPRGAVARGDPPGAAAGRPHRHGRPRADRHARCWRRSSARPGRASRSTSRCARATPR